MAVHQLTHITYPPANHCIYCGATDVPLSKEHIIPLSLWGRLTIPQASCDTCRKVTKEFEETCSRKMLGNFRVAANAPTRHPKERPSILTMPNISLDGRVNGIVEIAAEDYPPILHLPTFPPPSILETGYLTLAVPLGMWVGVPSVETIPEKNDDRMLTGTLTPPAFTRLLAKIGHCTAYAISQSRSDMEFDALLVNHILNEDQLAFSYIGCLTRRAPAIPRIRHRLYYHLKRHRSLEFLCVDIRLFSDLGAPTYRVVAAQRPIFQRR